MTFMATHMRTQKHNIADLSSTNHDLRYHPGLCIQHKYDHILQYSKKLQNSFHAFIPHKPLMFCCYTAQKIVIINLAKLQWLLAGFLHPKCQSAILIFYYSKRHISQVSQVKESICLRVQDRI